MSVCLKDLAEDYFNFLAETFPVMCSNDEFHFLPRVQAAEMYSDRMEDLQKDKITDAVSVLRKFQKRFDDVSIHESDIEGHIDRDLLKTNVADVLNELENVQSWHSNPLLYLKIAFIGLDHAISKPASSEDERQHRIQARLRTIPRLLQHAALNLEGIPETFLLAAQATLKDGRQYMTETFRLPNNQTSLAAGEAFQKTLDSLSGFDKYLQVISPVPDRTFFIPVFKESLIDSYSTDFSLSEIFQLADQEMQGCLRKLFQLATEIDPGKSWLELYNSYLPQKLDKIDTITLYEREIKSLSLFFQENGFGPTDIQTTFLLCETPTYLRSIRSSASFSAALNTSTGDKDRFYITTDMSGEGNQTDKEMQKKRLHREYKFLSAHEVIPGHHQLDFERRKLKNPIRRQIESPLFYEGWATYAETLLGEYGYLEDPRDSLVDYKRRLWRAARCRIDVGINAGILTPDEASQMLLKMGFASGEAERQVNRIQLNPGYQLCYFLGRHEIMKLRQSCEKRLDLKHFHRLLLEGGELPFHLIEKRLKAFISRSITTEEE